MRNYFHARHMDRIQPFRVMALLAEARNLEAQGRSIVHMEVGEPDFDTPPTIVEAGIRALRAGKTHYTPAVGELALRQQICHYYRVQYDIEVAPDRILITPGASGALLLVLSALIDPGDQVIMADPGYPCNRNFVHLLGGEPLSVPVSAASHFQLNESLVSGAWTERCRVLLLASPSNPTGTIINRHAMKTMIDFVASKQGITIVDEIYQGLSYEARADTALLCSDDIFVINSFSKYFGMTGWRLGWVVAPSCYIDDLDKLAQNLYLAASTPAQQAALSAFEPATLEILEQRVETFRQRRDYLIPALEKLGFRIPVVPEGAFYVYADCSGLTGDSLQFCHDVLHEAGVAITPGLDFGENNPQSYIRFAYTTDLLQLQEGIRRLQDFINKHS